MVFWLCIITAPHRMSTPAVISCLKVGVGTNSPLDDLLYISRVSMVVVWTNTTTIDTRDMYNKSSRGEFVDVGLLLAQEPLW